MTHRGPFQPLLFCDSVIMFATGLELGFEGCRNVPPETGIQKGCASEGAVSET